MCAPVFNADSGRRFFLGLGMRDWWKMLDTRCKMPVFFEEAISGLCDLILYIASDQRERMLKIVQSVPACGAGPYPVFYFLRFLVFKVNTEGM